MAGFQWILGEYYHLMASQNQHNNGFDDDSASFFLGSVLSLKLRFPKTSLFFVFSEFFQCFPIPSGSRSISKKSASFCWVSSGDNRKPHLPSDRFIFSFPPHVPQGSKVHLKDQVACGTDLGEEKPGCLGSTYFCGDYNIPL